MDKNSGRGGSKEPIDELFDAAIEALASLGNSASAVDLCAVLAELLIHEDWRVRKWAAYAVLRRGNRGSTPIIMRRITKLLFDVNWQVQHMAVAAYKVIWRQIPDSIVLSRLAELLGEDKPPYGRRVYREVSRYLKLFGVQLRGQTPYDHLGQHWRNNYLIRAFTGDLVQQMMASGIRIFKRRSPFGTWEARTVVDLSHRGIWQEHNR